MQTQIPAPKPKLVEIQIFDNCLRICFTVKQRLAAGHAKEIAADLYKRGVFSCDWSNADISYERTRKGYNYIVDVPINREEKDAV